MKDPVERITLMQDFVMANYDVYPEIAKEYADSAFELSTKINYIKGLGYGYLFRGFTGLYLTADKNPEENFENAERLFIQANDLEGKSRAVGMKAYSLWWKGQYDKALKLAFESLRTAEESGLPEALGWANYSTGVFHYDLKDYVNSEMYYLKALNHFKGDNIKRPHAVYRCYSGLGSVMIATKNYEKALEYIRLSVEGYRLLNNPVGEARALNDLGVIMILLGNFEEGENYLLLSLEIRERLNYHQGITTTCIELGRLHLDLNNNEAALEYLLRALTISEQTGTKAKMYQAHELLGEVYKKMNDLKNALEHKEKFFAIKTEISGEQATNKLKNLQTQFAVENSEKEAEIQRLKNVELKKAYDLIEEKNKSITDSINYARRIQYSLLTSEIYIHRSLERLTKK